METKEQIPFTEISAVEFVCKELGLNKKSGICEQKEKKLLA